MRVDGIRLLITGALLVVPSVAPGSVDSVLQQESRNLYTKVPDAAISLPAGGRVRLSELWRDKPLLITLFYSNCTGACNPFLRSLKSAIDATGGPRGDYRVVSLSFDPSDTVEKVAALATSLGIAENDEWLFGTASSQDVNRVAAAVGFWYKRQPQAGQYDHPTLVAAVRDGKIVRVLLGSTVSRRRFQEMLMDIKGDFVPFYASPGEKTIFRCLQVDEATGQVRLNWGLLLLLLPAFAALAVAALLFRIRKGAGPGGTA